MAYQIGLLALIGFNLAFSPQLWFFPDQKDAIQENGVPRSPQVRQVAYNRTCSDCFAWFEMPERTPGLLGQPQKDELSGKRHLTPTSRPFFLIVYTDVALGILKNTTDGTSVFGRSAVQDIEGV